jgi:hypothetical protein
VQNGNEGTHVASFWMADIAGLCTSPEMRGFSSIKYCLISSPCSLFGVAVEAIDQK